MSWIESYSVKQSADRHFYLVFILALFTTLFPSRALGYVIPFICLAFFIVKSRSGKTFARAVILVLLYILVVSFYWALYKYEGVDFFVSNAIVSFFTYGSIIYLLVEKDSFVSPNYSYLKYAKILRYVLLIEGIVGTTQFVLVSATGRFDILPGDAVQGTIGLFAFISGNPGFGNQMFAINMVFFLVFFSPYLLIYRKGIVPFLIGLLSLMMAGVLHVFIALLFSLLLTLFFFRSNLLFSNIGKLIGAVFLVGLLILPLQIIFPEFSRTASVFLALYQDLDSPKFRIVERTVGDMPDEYPFVNLVGLGPGQYLSRAGLISSGDYTERPLPFLANTTSEPLRKYGFQTWDSYASNTDRYGGSTMHQPYFSSLSLYAEFGLLFLLLLFVYLIALILKMRRLYLANRRKGDDLSSYISFALGLLLLFLFSISFFDNYLETTQAIFPGLLLMSAFRRSLKVGIPLIEKPTNPVSKSYK